MGRKKVEVKKTYSDYQYITLVFAPGDIGLLEMLANIRPDRRTVLVEKWYSDSLELARIKGQHEHNL